MRGKEQYYISSNKCPSALLIWKLISAALISRWGLKNGRSYYKIIHDHLYKAVWQIPKLTLKVCLIGYDALNYISVLFLMSFKSYTEYRL